MLKGVPAIKHWADLPKFYRSLFNVSTWPQQVTGCFQGLLSAIYSFHLLNPAAGYVGMGNGAKASSEALVQLVL